MRNEGYIHEFGSEDSKGRMACFECIPAKFMLKRLMGHKEFSSNGIKAFKRAVNIVQLFCPSVTSVSLSYMSLSLTEDAVNRSYHPNGHQALTRHSRDA